VVQGVLLAS
jgi:hypothetical protein